MSTAGIGTGDSAAFIEWLASRGCPSDAAMHEFAADSLAYSTAAEWTSARDRLVLVVLGVKPLANLVLSYSPAFDHTESEVGLPLPLHLCWIARAFQHYFIGPTTTADVDASCSSPPPQIYRSTQLVSLSVPGETVQYDRRLTTAIAVGVSFCPRKTGRQSYIRGGSAAPVLIIPYPTQLTSSQPTYGWDGFHYTGADQYLMVADSDDDRREPIHLRSTNPEWWFQWWTATVNSHELLLQSTTGDNGQNGGTGPGSGGGGFPLVTQQLKILMNAFTAATTAARHPHPAPAPELSPFAAPPPPSRLKFLFMPERTWDRNRSVCTVTVRLSIVQNAIGVASALSDSFATAPPASSSFHFKCDIRQTIN